MNVLYFSLDDFNSIENYHGINTDLLREFQRNGNTVYAISPVERRKHLKTHVIHCNGSTILKPKIGNIQKTNIIEKGISTVFIGKKLITAIKKEFRTIRFDIIVYCTPPITFLSAIRYVKNRDGSKTYLLLKDIFPQNAVDIGLLSKKGVKGLIYLYFRRKEKLLYEISDRIGCMSSANVNYILRHNPSINCSKIEVCPNCIDAVDKSVDKANRERIRLKYDIPLDKTVFVYGGNLGKPQGIPFVIECLKACQEIDQALFLIVGDGTEYHLLYEYSILSKSKNFKLMKRIPKSDYDNLVGACDVGLIFLDYRFSIPNFPSRLLSYMQAKLPVIACTDPNTDIGKVVVENHFGWCCESNNVESFKHLLLRVLNEDYKALGENAFDYLNKHYTTNIAYNTIIRTNCVEVSHE